MRNSYLLSLLLIGTLLLTPFTGAKAEDAPSFELDQVVVTATKTPVKLAEAGANISVITKEEIEKMHYRSVADALRNVPGVEVSSYGSPGGRNGNNFSINGSFSNIVLIDGKRMNLSNQMAGPYSAVDLNNIMGMDNIERIEVMKGSASALYGADAIGGVINIITKKGEQNKTTLKMAGGSFNRESYGVSHQGKDRDLSWYLTAIKDKSGNFKDGNGKTVEESYYDTKFYSLCLNKKLNDQEEISFSYQSYDGSERAPGSSTGSWGPTNMKDKEQSWDLTYIGKKSDKASSQLKVYQNSSLFKDYSVGNFYDVKVQGAQYQLSSQVNEKHLLIGGIDYYKDELHAEEFNGTPIVNKIAKSNTALYLQDRWNLNKKFTLDAGMRLDHHQTYGSKATPRLTLSYKQNEATNYYVSYNEFFKAPSLFQLYADIPSYPFKGNPNLKPEKGHSIEAGVKHKFDKTLQGTVHYFDRRTNDAIVATTNWKSYENNDKQKASGWDIQLSKQITPELSTFFGYTYLSIKNKKGSGDYEKDKNVPEKTWNLGVNYVKDKYNLQVKGRGVENKPGKNNKFPESSYWVWDAAANVKINSDVNAFVKVNNIFDQYYAEYANSKNDCWPAAGRNYLFGLDYSF